MYRAVYFDPNKTKPEFRWLPSRDEDAIHDLFPQGTGLARLQFDVNLLSGDRQERMLTVRCDDNYYSAYTEPNPAVLHSTQGLQAHMWGGPVVAYVGDGRSLDFNMVDFHNLIAIFITYWGDDEKAKRLKGPKLPAVIFPCDGEKRLGGVTSTQRVQVPRLHYVWNANEDVSEISKVSKLWSKLRATVLTSSQLIGEPIYVVEYASNAVKSKVWNECGDRCSSATFMKRGTDPSVEFAVHNPKASFGFAPPSWFGGRVGNVLIARVDREDLDPEWVDAFTDFCRHHASACFQWLSERPHLKQSDIQLALNQFTPKIWAAYLLQWKALKAETGNAETVLTDGVTEDSIDGVPRMILTDEDLLRFFSRLSAANPWE
jgi:hypothetical protein